MIRTITWSNAMLRIYRHQYILVILMFSLLGCHDLPTETEDNTINGFKDLVAFLQKSGLIIKSKGKASPLLSCISAEKTFEMIVNDDIIQIFEFNNKEAADKQAENISPNGTSIIGSESACSILFVDTPHFFKKNKLIVLYVGKNTSVINALIEKYGTQFAGG